MSVLRHHKITRAELNALATDANATTLNFLPFQFIPKTYPVVDQTQMLALAEGDDGIFPGNIAIRQDTLEAYQLTAPDYTNLANWHLLSNWFVYNFDTGPTPPAAPAAAGDVLCLDVGIVTRIGVDDLGVLKWIPYLGWISELNRIRTLAMAEQVNVSQSVFIDEDGTQYLLFNSPDPRLFSDERFSFTGPLSLSRYPYRDISYAFPEDAGCSIQWNFSINPFIDFTQDGATYYPSTTFRIKIAHNIVAGRLTGAFRVQWNSGSDRYADLVLSDPSILVVSKTRVGGFAQYNVDATLSTGEYYFTVTIPTDGVRNIFAGSSGSFVMSITTQVEKSHIHGTQRVFEIGAGDIPLISHPAFLAPGIWAPFTPTLTVTGGAGGFFLARTFAPASCNYNPDVLVNGLPETVLAHPAEQPITTPRANVNVAFPIHYEEDSYSGNRHIDGIGAPRLPFTRQPQTLKVVQWRGIPPTPSGQPLPIGTKISSVVVGRKLTGTPQVFLATNTPLAVTLGCIRNSVFVAFTAITIPAGRQYSDPIFPEWINFTSDALAYSCSEAIDVQAMVLGKDPSLYFSIDIHGAVTFPNYTGPLFAHFYNDAEKLIALAP